MALPTARVYRNIELRQLLFGLEYFDALGLGLLTVVLMLVNPHGVFWNVAVLLAGYAGLRVLKRGKPEGYTLTLARFYFRRPYFSAAATDVEGAAHAFPFAQSDTSRPHTAGRESSTP